MHPGASWRPHASLGGVGAAPTLCGMDPATQRTQFTRKLDRGSYDRAAANAILDETLLGHLGFADATGQPMVLPVGIARDGERVLFHGSTGSRLFRMLAAGAPGDTRQAIMVRGSWL